MAYFQHIERTIFFKLSKTDLFKLLQNWPQKLAEKIVICFLFVWFVLFVLLQFVGF